MLAPVKGKSLRDCLRPPLTATARSVCRKIRSGQGDVADRSNKEMTANKTLDSCRPIQVQGSRAVSSRIIWRDASEAVDPNASIGRRAADGRTAGMSRLARLQGEAWKRGRRPQRSSRRDQRIGGRQHGVRRAFDEASSLIPSHVGCSLIPSSCGARAWFGPSLRNGGVASRSPARM